MMVRRKRLFVRMMAAALAVVMCFGEWCQDFEIALAEEIGDVSGNVVTEAVDEGESVSGSDIIETVLAEDGCQNEDIDKQNILDDFSMVTASGIVISQDIIEKAIAYGRSLLGSYDYTNYCQKFVNHCFIQGGFSNVSFESAKKCANALTISTDINAPRGAVVFFDSKSSPYGHIGISLGDGTMIHAGHKGVEITRFTNASYLAEYYWLTYTGWGVWGQQKGNSLAEGGTPSPSFSYQTNGPTGTRGFVTENNACLETRVYTSITSDIKCGIRIGTAANNWNIVNTHW